MHRRIALFTAQLPDAAQLERLRAAGLDPRLAPVAREELDRVAVLLVGLERIDRTEMQRYPSLGLIALSSTGTDNVDLSAAAELGIRVSNVPGQASEEVAGHALALILALLHNVPMHDRNLRDGLWDSRKDIVPAPRASGMTLGIIGVGRIGRSLAHQARNVFRDVIGFDPYLAADETPTEIAWRRSAAELVSDADVLSVHVPRTPATEKLLGGLDLRSGRVRYLINVSRGGLFSHAQLLELLETDVLAGVGLDAFDPEPPGPDPLIRHPRVISTPHRAFESVESLEAYDVFPVDNALAFAAGVTLKSPVGS